MNHCLSLALSRTRNLNQEYAETPLIYLDTRYWIDLRNAQHGSVEHPEYLELFQTLKSAVEQGVIICPISDQVLVELLSCEDPERGRKSLETISTLSNGVAIKSFKELLDEEHMNFVRSIRKSRFRNVQPLTFAYSTIFTNTTLKEFASVYRHYHQNHILDLIYTTDLSIYTETYYNAFLTKCRVDPNEINRAIVSERKTSASFSEILSEEVKGVTSMLDLGSASVRMMCNHFRSKSAEVMRTCLTGATAAQTKTNRSEIYRLVPSTAVYATCFSALRVEGRRMLKSNDVADFFHASLAVPYCRGFFTEKSLAHLLTTRPSELQAYYNCKVVSAPSEAIEFIKELTVNHNSKKRTKHLLFNVTLT